MLELLLGEARVRGWAAPQCEAGRLVWWAHNNDTGVDHLLQAAAVAGGIQITGRANVYPTAAAAADAIREQAERYEDAGFLALFGLKRDWGLPGAPVVPIGLARTRNEYGDALRQMGIW